MSKIGKLDSSKFWERVDYLRSIKDISIADLQTAIGKNGTYLYVARANNAMPSTEIIVKMADAFGCTVDYLLDHVLVSEEHDDPELEMVIQKWKTDPNFRVMLQSIMRQLTKASS